MTFPFVFVSPPPPTHTHTHTPFPYPNRGQGDLGRFNPITGDLIVTGRAKDTIVLSNGENVEPQPLEVSGFKENAVCTYHTMHKVQAVRVCFIPSFFNIEAMW